MFCFFFDILFVYLILVIDAFAVSQSETNSAVLQAELHGVLPVHKGEFEGLQKSALRWGNRLKQAVAVCNSLNMVNKHTVVGVDMERTMFKAVEARFLVCIPLGACEGCLPAPTPPVPCSLSLFDVTPVFLVSRAPRVDLTLPTPQAYGSASCQHKAGHLPSAVKANI